MVSQLADDLKIGDLVEIAHPAFRGKRAVVYELYKDFEQPGKQGASFVLETGTPTSGWSYSECCRFTKLIRATGFQYYYKNDDILRQDIRAGRFDSCFAEPETEEESGFWKTAEMIVFPLFVVMFLLFTMIAFC